MSYYETRWAIEEYHKGMKTGCEVETLQFTTVEGLTPTIALLSVVAVFLLGLRDMGSRSEAGRRAGREAHRQGTVGVPELGALENGQATI